MGKLTYRDPLPGDAERLAKEMRACDRREVIAASGPDLLKTIRRSISLSSHVAVAEHKGELVAIVGIAPLSLSNGVAAPWLLCTPLISGHTRTLGRAAARYIAHVSGLYPTLVNWVDARNEASLRLIRWLGFTVSEPEPFGAAGLPFSRFEKRSV